MYTTKSVFCGSVVIVIIHSVPEKSTIFFCVRKYVCTLECIIKAFQFSCRKRGENNNNNNNILRVVTYADVFLFVFFQGA